jgi:hypothetical protein
LETITKNSDGTQTVSFSSPENPDPSTSGSVLNTALSRQAAHRSQEQGGGTAFQTLPGKLEPHTIGSDSLTGTSKVGKG